MEFLHIMVISSHYLQGFSNMQIMERLIEYKYSIHLHMATFSCRFMYVASFSLRFTEFYNIDFKSLE